MPKRAAANFQSRGDGTQRELFGGLRVLSFEHRRAQEMQSLIARCGGVSTNIAVLHEEELRDDLVAQFARALLENRVDIAIFTTASGVRLLFRQIEEIMARADWTSAMSRVQVVARGAQTVAALDDLKIAVALIVPAPHTWRETLSSIQKSDLISLRGKRVAVQESGAPNRALMRTLAARGAQVSRIRVYKWALPLDTAPILRAINGVIEGAFDVVLWTNGAQVWHVFQLADRNGIEDEFRRALRRLVVASVGPNCSEALREWEIVPTLEAPQSRLDELVFSTALFASRLRAASP